MIVYSEDQSNLLTCYFSTLSLNQIATCNWPLKLQQHLVFFHVLVQTDFNGFYHSIARRF